MAEVVIVESPVAAGAIAAGAIAALVARKPDAVLGLATGSTPLTTWAALAGEAADLSRVRAFALDEYVGLPPGHPESYRAVVQREIVEPLGLNPALVRVPGDDGPLEGGRRALRGRDRGGQRGRPPGARHRPHRASRLQRARIVVRVAHAREDPHRADPRRQCTVLRGAG